MVSSRPAVLVISSHVVRGTVGGRAAALALELLGFRVWSIPTVILPWHPGHHEVAGVPQRHAMSDDEFTSLIDQLLEAPWLDEVGAVLTGYFGNAQQVVATAEMVRKLKRKNPDLLYVLDPVIGDGSSTDGRLYVPEAQAALVREQLLPIADITTPNTFELAWLACKGSIDTATDAQRVANSLAVDTVLTTSVPALKAHHIATMISSGGVDLLAENRLIDGPANGLGDMMAALLLGNWLMRDDPNSSLDQILAQVCGGVYDVARYSQQAGSDELLLEQAQALIHKPMSTLDIRTLMSGTR